MNGLVLEGGGAKGSYQIGSYKALKELGLEFNGVAGTSIGAINGAFIVQDDFEKLEELWNDLTPDKVITMEEKLVEQMRNIDSCSLNFNIMSKIITKSISEKGMDIGPLKMMLKKYLNENKIRKSKKDFGIVTVSINNGVKPEKLFLEDIPKNKLINYLIASASLPIFKLEKLNDKLYIDGGFCDNLPISMLKEKRYKDIVVVRLYNNNIICRKTNTKNMNVVYINPSENLGSILDFSFKNVSKNINLGYYDTYKAFKKIEGIKYYISLNEVFTEDYCFKLITSLSDETMKNISMKFGIKGDIYKRTFMEYIIPKIGHILNLRKDFTYKEFIYGIYEQKMKELNYEKLKIYNFCDLFDDINKNSIEYINCNLFEYNLKIMSPFKEKLVKSVTNDIIIDIQKTMLQN